MNPVIPDNLPEQIAWLVREVGELRRRDRNRKRTGKIKEVDLKKGLARVEFEERDGKPYLGPWMPWKEVAAGGIKSHIPPTVGEQVDVVSESGDIGDGIIDMSTPSNQNKRPHDGPEAVIKHGDSTLMIASGKITITTPHLEIVGNSVTHNGREIGHEHKHIEVMPGGGLSGPPEG